MGNHFDENNRGESRETVTIHPRVTDVKGSGKTDGSTGRYIPVSGGSRTRIPIRDDKRVSRYTGNLGIDAKLSGKIDSMAALYAQLDSRTKQALGSDFPESIGRTDLAANSPEANVDETADFEDYVEVDPMDEAPQAVMAYEVPESEPTEEPPQRKLHSFLRKDDEFTI